MSNLIDQTRYSSPLGLSISAVIKVHFCARRYVSTCKIQAQICINIIEIDILKHISPHLIFFRHYTTTI